jgi:hypothetical protein
LFYYFFGKIFLIEEGSASFIKNLKNIFRESRPNKKADRPNKKIPKGTSSFKMIKKRVRKNSIEDCLDVKKGLILFFKNAINLVNFYFIK